MRKSVIIICLCAALLLWAEAVPARAVEAMNGLVSLAEWLRGENIVDSVGEQEWMISQQPATSQETENSQEPAMPQEVGIPQELITNKDNPVLLMFTASWCAPCHFMRNVIFKNGEVAALLKKYNIVMLDIETPLGASLQRQYCSQYAVPYYILLDKYLTPIVAQIGANEKASEFATFLRRGLPTEGTEALQDAVNQEDMNILTGDDYKAAYKLSIDRVPSSWHLIVEASGLVSNVSNSPIEVYGVGYGAFVGAQLRTYRVSFETGVMFNSIGGVVRIGATDFAMEMGERIYFNYIGVPVDVGFRLYRGLFIGVGLSGAYQLSDISSIGLTYKKVDVSLRGKLSYNFGSKVPLRISVGYHKGLVNLRRGDILNSSTNNTFALSVAYSF